MKKIIYFTLSLFSLSNFSYAACAQNINMSSHTISNLQTPQAPGDAANKAYVDALVGSSGGTTGTGAMLIPVGTTVQRPGTALAGMIRYNSTLSLFEGYTGSSWVALSN